MPNICLHVLLRILLIEIEALPTKYIQNIYDSLPPSTEIQDFPQESSRFTMLAIIIYTTYYTDVRSVTSYYTNEGPKTTSATCPGAIGCWRTEKRTVMYSVGAITCSNA